MKSNFLTIKTPKVANSNNILETNKDLQDTKSCKLQLNEFIPHEYTGFTRQYDTEFLKKDIEKRGQLMPALLWFDKRHDEWVIVDGVHRQIVCNELNIKLKTTKLAKTVKEDEIPGIILALMLRNKTAGKTIAAIETVVYLEMVKNKRGALKDVIDEYQILTKVSIASAKTIFKLRIDWFETLRLGNKVEYAEGKYTDSLRLVSDTAKSNLKKSKAGAVMSNNEELTGKSKELRLMFNSMEAFAKQQGYISGENDFMWVMNKYLKSYKMDNEITEPETYESKFENDLNEYIEVKGETDLRFSLELGHDIKLSVDGESCYATGYSAGEAYPIIYFLPLDFYKRYKLAKTLAEQRRE